MKLSAAMILAALSTLTTAQYYDIQSPGFRLFIKSTNSTINGTALGACHQGAAIEGLCLTSETVQDPPSSYTTFYHNVSSFANQPAGADNADGPLSWILQAAGNLTVPSAMYLSLSATSNVANPTFSPGTNKYDVIAFDKNGSVYISAGLNDTVSPPTYFSPNLKVNNWYICLTRWSYLYYTLSWKVGLTGKPQNPSCQKVDIVRVFN